MSEPIAHFYAPDRQAWRTWLAEHHATMPGIWLVYYKQQSGKPRVAYADAVEEALCFGWIDSRTNPLDAERSLQWFSPRKPKSPWSKLNKARVERLIAQGLMTDAGFAAIAISQRNDSWTSSDEVEALQVPADLQAALNELSTAQEHFAAFSPTTKKQLLWWVLSAKRPETRTKRITQIVAAAADNINPIAYDRTKKRS